MNINLCIYNTQSRPFLDPVCYKADHIGPKLNDFDLVCLQECFAGDERLANNTNFTYKINPDKKRHFYNLVDSGLLVLSNLNLQKTYFEIYNDYASFQDFIASKGFLMTRWKINNKYLDVYTTHMQAGGTQSGFDAAQGQADQLVNAINKLTPKENGLLVVGDFNMGPLRNKTYVELSDIYEDEITMINRMNIFNSIIVRLHLIDVWDVLETNPAYNGFDRCLFRNGTNVTINPNNIRWDNTFIGEDGKQLSDSKPIIVNLTIS